MPGLHATTHDQCYTQAYSVTNLIPDFVLCCYLKLCVSLFRWRHTHPRPSGEAQGGTTAGARGAAYPDGKSRVEGSLRRSAQSAGDYLKATGRDAEEGAGETVEDAKAWGRSAAGQNDVAAESGLIWSTAGGP